jgi:hypothetical protein
MSKSLKESGMGIAFHQTDINIQIAKKRGKEIAKLLLDKGWIAEDMPFDAALAAIGWHGRVQKSVLEMTEIDVDKMTDQVHQRLEALAPFVRDGSFVRFESEESSKDYALCVFEGGKAHGYGWLATQDQSSTAAAIGTPPSGAWNNYIHDESPSREKLADHRYWAVAAWNMAQNIGFIASSSRHFGAKDADLVRWIIRACEEARAALLGERPLIVQDIQMYGKEVGKIPQTLAEHAQEAKVRWLKGPRKKLAALPFAIGPDELAALLPYRATFAPERGILVGGQEGVFQAEVLSFFEHLRKASWYRQIGSLEQAGGAYREVILDFQGMMSDVTESADLKESLLYLHRMTSVEQGGDAITPGVDSEDIAERAPGIHKAMARISQLAAS